MPAASRVRIQPARLLLRQNRWSIPAAARYMNVPRGHLHMVMYGMAAPSEDVRRLLPDLLQTPLEDLFESWLLAREYRGPNRNAALDYSREQDGGAQR